MIAPSKNFAFLFIAAGLVMISVFFLTASPFDIMNVIIGTIPLILLFCFGFSIWKARKKPEDDETQKGGH